MTAISISRWTRQHYDQLRWLVYLMCVLPGLWLYSQLHSESLGINPLQELQQETGLWSLRFLCITLAITPLRRLLANVSVRIRARDGKRLSDWNWIIKTRRPLGLASFFYACAHSFIYLHFDVSYQWQWFLEDTQQKLYLNLGLISFFIMTILALTSPTFFMRALGKVWRYIHRWIYLLSIVVLWHSWLASKYGDDELWYYTAIISFLLAYRILAKIGFGFNKPKDDGMEVKPR